VNPIPSPPAGPHDDTSNFIASIPAGATLVEESGRQYAAEGPGRRGGTPSAERLAGKAAPLIAQEAREFRLPVLSFSARSIAAFPGLDRAYALGLPAQGVHAAASFDDFPRLFHGLKMGPIGPNSESGCDMIAAVPSAPQSW
jgi:hypothetical protein